MPISENLKENIKFGFWVAGIVSAIFSVIRYGFIPLVKWKKDEAINNYRLNNLEKKVDTIQKDVDEIKDNMK